MARSQLAESAAKTMSKRAATSLMRESGSGTKSTVTEARAWLVARFALDEQLRVPRLLALAPDLEMDVRRAAARITHGLDGAEIILASRSCQESPKALEIRVVLGLLRAVGQINAHAIDLPNLDGGVANWAAAGVNQAAAHVRDLAYGRRDRIVDDNQVVVGVQRQFRRIKRAFLGGGGFSAQFFGESAGHGEERRAQAQLTQEFAPRSMRRGQRMRGN